MRLPYTLHLLVAGTCLALAGAVLAQAYPNRPVRLIVPYPPGQATDILGRLIAEKLAAPLGQPVIVDNRAGAGGLIGTEAGARAAPDGYTLVMATSGPIAISPSLYAKVPYDSLRDFAPIANMASVAHALVTAGNSPATNFAEFVAMTKAKPGALNYASPGAGTTQHLAMEMLRSRLSLDMVHIPYKGSAPAQLDVMSGKVLVVFDTISAVLGHVKSGTLRALGVSSAQRSPFLPNVPSVSESGVPGFESAGWLGIAAPAGTPAPIVFQLNAEIVKILGSQDMRERLASFAFVPIGDTPEQFQAHIRSEVVKWAKVVKDSGAKID